MPIYEYVCQQCKTEFELRLSFRESDGPALCPKCHSSSQKLISSFACKHGANLKAVEKPFRRDTTKELELPNPSVLITPQPNQTKLLSPSTKKNPTVFDHLDKNRLTFLLFAISFGVTVWLMLIIDTNTIKSIEASQVNYNAISNHINNSKLPSSQAGVTIIYTPNYVPPLSKSVIFIPAVVIESILFVITVIIIYRWIVRSILKRN